MRAAEAPLLEVSNLSVSYGGLPAVRDISFTVPAGHSLALVGANGAGKTTSLLAVARCLPPGAALTGEVRVRAANGGAGRGSVSLIPAQDKVFSLLTTEENLLVASRRQRGSTVGPADTYAWFPRLAERRRSLAGNLSGGEQQMLALAMGLVGSPELVLLDEPTLGLAVPMIESLCQTLDRLRRELNITLVLAEADANWIDRLADSALVIDRGATVTLVDDDLAGNRDRMQKLALGLGIQETLASEAPRA